MNMGALIPILCEEVVPGDTFKMNTEVLLRMAPLVAPVMHRVNVYTHFFFVPNRLIWSEWEDKITGGEDGLKNPVLPYIQLKDSNTDYFKSGSLADYLGCASNDNGNYSLDNKVNALPFRAYAQIWNDYYRDQNLQAKIAISKASGEDTSDILIKRVRNWEKDYFTSSLPWTQRGGDVSVPLTGEAIVKLDIGLGDRSQSVFNSDGSVNASVKGLYAEGGTGKFINGDYQNQLIDPNDTLYADLSEGAGAPINELRRATRLQQWLEKNARGGARYIEQMLVHFGVRSSDARLQRPEYLGGGKSPVVISEVLQTAATDETSPQGNMAGHGISVGNSHGFKKFFEEHGFVIGIISVLPRTSYQQGTRRIFRKFDKFDYYFPSFANLGEQEVFRTELYNTYNESSENYNKVFGYQSRYAEYKYIPSSVHGDFRIEDNGLDKWHMGRTFAAAPNLNGTFVSSIDVPQRNFAITDPAVPKLYVQVYNDLTAMRPLPFFSEPTL